MAPDLWALTVLSQNRVPFVVIGGHAVNVHGVLRATEGTDVVWLRSRESEGNLLRALVEIDAHSIGNEIDPATGIEKIYPVTESFVRAGGLMMLCTNAGFLDLFDSIPGFPHERLIAVSQACPSCRATLRLPQALRTSQTTAMPELEGRRARIGLMRSRETRARDSQAAQRPSDG